MNIFEVASKIGIATAFAKEGLDAINNASQHAKLAQPLNEKLTVVGLKPLSEEQLRIASQVGGVVYLGLTAGLVLSKRSTPYALALGTFTLAATALRSLQPGGIDMNGIAWGMQHQLMITAAQGKFAKFAAKSEKRSQKLARKAAKKAAKTAGKRK